MSAIQSSSSSGVSTSTSNNNNNMLDLDASPIMGQTGWSILDLQGNILQQSNFQNPNDSRLLFEMLQESTSLVVSVSDNNNNNNNNNGLKRMTVTFGEKSRYLITRDDNYIYLVQTKV